MNSYQNLPWEQRTLQRLVDQFNGDESQWLNLQTKRLSRRIHQPELSYRELEILDMLDCAVKNCQHQFVWTCG